MRPENPILKVIYYLGRGITWRHDDERMSFLKCDDDPFLLANSIYLDRPLYQLSKKMMDNYGPARVTASLKTHELSLQVSL